MMFSLPRALFSLVVPSVHPSIHPSICPSTHPSIQQLLLSINYMPGTDLDAGNVEMDKTENKKTPVLMELVF